MQKTAVPIATIKDAILTLAHENPEARHLTAEDITIINLGDGRWNAAFHRSGPAITDSAAFAALPFVQSKYSLAC